MIFTVKKIFIETITVLFFHISDLKCEEHVVYSIKFIKKQAKHLSCFVCKLSCHGAIVSTKFLQYIKAFAFMTKNNNRKKKIKYNS